MARQQLLFLGMHDSRYGGKIDVYLAEHGNGKTGRVAGLIVMPAGTIDVRANLRQGNDRANCGRCPMRSTASGGNGSCYVPHSMIANGVGGLLANRGVLPVASDDQIRAMLADYRILRSAIYGDAAALPVSLWQTIETACKAVGLPIVGYTHGASGGVDIAHLTGTHQVSVDGEVPATGGYFRVREYGQPLLAGERMCPSDPVIGLLGKRGQACNACQACNGTTKIAIHNHDSAGRATMRRALAAGTLSIAAVNRKAA